MAKYIGNLNYLVHNLNQSHLYFYKAKKGLYYDSYTKNNLSKRESCLIENDMLDYSINVDKENNIHLVFIDTSGKLNYFIYNNNKITKHSLQTLDIKSNIHINLTLKIINNNIHIFYSTCNLISPSLWTIKHIVKKTKGWEKRNVISYTASKANAPFIVDFDRFGTIYLLYKNYNNKENHIYLTSTNATINKWVKQPTKISYDSSDNTHPYLFVDNRDNVHVSWCSLINNNLKLNYKKLSVNRLNKIIWSDVTLPSACINSTHPYIYEKNAVLYFGYRQNGYLKYLSSSNYGFNWVYESYKVNVSSCELCFSVGRKENKLSKSNHSYLRADNSLIVHNDMHNSSNTATSSIKETKPVNGPIDTTLPIGLLNKKINSPTNNHMQYENIVLSEKEPPTEKNTDESSRLESLIKQNESMLKELNESINLLKDKQINIYEDIDSISSNLIEIKSLISSHNKSKLWDKLFDLLS